MDIKLNNVGKRYRFEWIFKGLELHIQQGEQWVILGSNGSGKSTLLKILSGHLTPSKGEIIWTHQGKSLDKEVAYRHIALAAPYVELIEEFTLVEALDFHRKFKPFQQNLSTEKLIEILNFQSSRNKPIQFFSSGMKQRLKLVLAICSEAPLLLLDEPTTNLDAQGVAWYLELIETYTQNKTLIIASNIEHDYGFCSNSLNILAYKK